MIRLLKAERRKLTTVRSLWLLVAATAAVPILNVIAMIQVSEADRSDLEPGLIVDLIRGGAGVSVVAALLLGIIAVAGEHRHGTVIGSLLAEPRRTHYIGAKLITLTFAGGTVAAATVAVSVISGGLYLDLLGYDVWSASASDAVAAAVGVIVAGALHGTIGAGVGAAVRNQTAAVTGALVWLLAVEGVLPIFFQNEGLRHWTLSGAAARLFHLSDPIAGSQPAWAAAALLAAVATVLGIFAVAVTRVADVD